MANQFNNPFSGKPYVNAPPGVDAARRSLEATPKLAPPRDSAPRVRLAHAIARIPGASRHPNARNLFLP